MMSLTYQERSLYGTLLADLMIYLPYLTHDSASNSLSRIAGTLLLLIVVQIVLQAAIAALTRNRLQDERDFTIRLRGYRAGYITFVTCVMLGLAALWMHAMFLQLNPQRMAIHFLSVLFGMVVVADVVRVLAQLIDYRRAL